MKKLPATTEKSEIKIKENPKAAAIKKAPDEVIAMAIRDAILKDKCQFNQKQKKFNLKYTLYQT